MNRLESALGETLRDERRRIAPPLDVTSWVGIAVRRQRQRQRNALVGAVIAALLVAVAVGVVIPMRSASTSASFVAGMPDVDSGLLRWEPVGTLADQEQYAEPAVQAWVDQAMPGEQPEGSVYVVMGEQWPEGNISTGDGTVLMYLQGRTESGDGSVALVKRSQGSEQWQLVAASLIAEASAIEFVVIPSGALQSPSLDDGQAGKELPDVAVLAPRWRVDTATPAAVQLGWKEVVPKQGGVASLGWKEWNRTPGPGWATSIGDRLSPEGNSHHLLLDVGGGRSLAEVDVPVVDGDGLLGVATGVRLSTLDRRSPDPEVIAPALQMADRLGWQGDLHITQVAQEQRGLWGPAVDGPVNAQMTVVQLDGSERRPVLAALAATLDGKELCFSHKAPPLGGIGFEYLNLAACTIPLSGSGSNGFEATWVLGQASTGETVPINVISVDIELAGGGVITEPLTQGRDEVVSKLILKPGGLPVTGYTFNGVDPFEGTPMSPVKWPAAE